MHILWHGYLLRFTLYALCFLHCFFMILFCVTSYVIDSRFIRPAYVTVSRCIIIIIRVITQKTVMIWSYLKAFCNPLFLYLLLLCFSAATLDYDIFVPNLFLNKSFRLSIFARIRSTYTSLMKVSAAVH
jgi:hypothetical protein